MTRELPLSMLMGFGRRPSSVLFFQKKTLGKPNSTFILYIFPPTFMTAFIDISDKRSRRSR